MNTHKQKEQVSHPSSSFGAVKETTSSWDNWDDAEDLNDDLDDELDAITRDMKTIKTAPNPAPKRTVNKPTAPPKRNILKKDTRKIPVIKKKEPVKAKKPAFPSFIKDDDEDNWDDGW